MNYQDITENQSSQNSHSSQSLHPSQAHTLTDQEQKQFSPTMYSGASFEAYAYSKAGHNKNSNYDNFYCNKTYMKGFKYVDFKKSAEIYDDNAIFAVCTGEGNEDEADEACKKVLAFLKEKETDILSVPTLAEVEIKLEQFLVLCDQFLYEQSVESHTHHEVNLLVTVFVEDKIVYASLGNVMLLRQRGKKTTEITKYVPLLMGTGRVSGVKSIEKSTCQTGDTYFLCSKGIKRTVTADSVGEALAAPYANVKEAVMRVIGNVIKCGVIRSSTCVAVSVKKESRIKMSTYIISALCGFITLIDLCIIIKTLIL